MKRLYAFFCFLCLASSVATKAKVSGSFGDYTYTVSGYVNPEVSLNTRQVESSRKGQEVEYPKKPVFDENGCDVNAEGDTTISPFNSRVKLRVDGPSVFDSDETYIVLSSDFRGISDDVREVARLRKAYINFRWCDTLVRFGQDNHPMYIGDCKPNRVSYAGAAPIESNTRVPQVKLIQSMHDQDGELSDEFWIQLYSHGRGLRDIGPDGSSTKYIRNAQIPGVALQWRKFYEKHLWGFLAGYKRIIPRLSSVVTENNEEKRFKDNEGLNSGYVAGYFCSESDRASVKTRIVYAWGGRRYWYAQWLWGEIL